MTADVPPLVRDAAVEFELGEFVGRYKHPQNFVTGLNVALLAPYPAMFALLAAFWTRNPGLWDRNVWQAVLSVVAAVFFGAIVVVAIAYAVRTKRNRAFYLYVGGLVATSRSGDIKLCANWNDLAVYWSAEQYILSGVDLGVRHYYRLVPKIGPVVKFSHRHGKSRLGPDLQQLSAGAKWPRIVERLNRGEQVRFGPIVVDNQAIEHPKGKLPSSMLTGLAMAEGGVEISDVSGRRTAWVPVDSVPDLTVLERLAREFAGSP